MRRFFAEKENIKAKTIILTEKNDIHHITKVLRLEKGDEINISDGNEWEYRTKILNISKDYCEAVILDKQRFTREPSLKITLFQGIPKQGKMEIVVQKATELGAVKIVPVFMDRTIVSDKSNIEKKVQRWQKIALEASKQCRRGVVADIGCPVKTDEMTDMFFEYDAVIFPYENEKNITIKDVLKKLKAVQDNYTKMNSPMRIGIVIGPEGGFSEQEAEKIEQKGAFSVSLGKTVLRTETAGIAAIAMTMYELEL